MGKVGGPRGFRTIAKATEEQFSGMLGELNLGFTFMEQAMLYTRFVDEAAKGFEINFFGMFISLI